MLLLMMESFAKERLIISDKTTDSTAHESASTKGKEKEATTSKSTDTDRNAEECRNDRKANNDDVPADWSKFEKVEMPVFSGEDPDSWLFQAERSSRDGTILGKILRIKQEYCNLFDKLVAPLFDVQEKVIEDTFMNGLLPWIRAEVSFCRLKGLVEMMQVA
ncbi:transposon Tf2-1 polyprotein isoform X1 [Cucumis melo var. makuwa]|uniref:Transposon Tf2-1 polyprotein isoform X1 n=1 Tax=Cucumis melo var. makuwa TaxID=1194695 RepID=A0A5A7TTG1_CUCMM|nr:transposon Tf2-1 polyprotein isoform X1 [Cucumis melo var. makuwa]